MLIPTHDVLAPNEIRDFRMKMFLSLRPLPTWLFPPVLVTCLPGHAGERVQEKLGRKIRHSGFGFHSNSFVPRTELTAARTLCFQPRFRMLENNDYRAGFDMVFIRGELTGAEDVLDGLIVD